MRCSNPSGVRHRGDTSTTTSQTSSLPCSPTSLFVHTRAFNPLIIAHNGLELARHPQLRCLCLAISPSPNPLGTSRHDGQHRARRRTKVARIAHDSRRKHMRSTKSNILDIRFRSPLPRRRVIHICIPSTMVLGRRRQFEMESLDLACEWMCDFSVWYCVCDWLSGDFVEERARGGVGGEMEER